MTKRTATKAELTGRIDNFLLRQLEDKPDGFALRDLKPVATWNRFDLGFKLLYLDALRTNTTQFVSRIYAAHIEAFSLGDMAEPGNDEKVGIDRFKSDFAATLYDIERNGFDPEQSLVPLAADGSLLNAGHRAACAIALGKPVTGVETGLEPKRFDFRFFEGRGVTEDDLDAAAMRMVDAMPNIAVALLWPAALGKDKQVDALVGPLVYRKNVALSLMGGHNLLSQVYRGEPWLGDGADDYPGIKRKLVACFNGSADLRVLIFDAPPDVYRVSLKDKVRALYGIDKSSIHVTDTHAEAVEVSRLLLNRNSRHFLNHGAPMKFAQTRENVAAMHSYLAQHDLSSRNIAVDTGMVMGMYGLRAPADIDVISDVPLPSGPVEQHDAQYRDSPPSEILQDPKRHFSYCGLTFTSLSEVAALKQKRLAGRDREDLLLIEPLLKQDGTAERSFGRRVQFFMLRRRRTVIRILFQAGIGAPLRMFYRRLRGR